MAAEATTRRPLAMSILRWLSVALLGLAALLAAILLGLNTAPGRRFIADRLGAYETASGIRIHVDRIEGSIYSQMTLVGLKVSDPRGVFLTAPRIAIDWRPFAYLHSRVDLRALAAPEIELLRNPALRPTPGDPNAPLLPDIDIAIGRLTVDRLVLDAPVTGRRHVVRLAGAADIADGRARIAADADALRGPGVAGGDRARVRLDAQPDADRLLIAATLDAPAGGVIDSYAGLGKPLALRIGGRGDWQAWTGRATGTVGGRTLADLGVAARAGTFTLRGKAIPAAILTGPAARLLAPAITIDARAVLAERRAQTRFTARSDALAVQGDGLIDLGRSRFGKFRIDGQLLRPGAIADHAAGRDIRFSAALDGPFATPAIAYTLHAAALGFDTLGIEGLEASGRATIDARHILIPVTATARRVTGLNAATGGLLTSLSVSGDLAYANGRLLSDNLRLRAPQLDATAIVVADPGRGRYTGALKGRVNDYQVNGLGRINLQTDARLVPGANGGFGIRGWVRGTTRRLDNASLRDFLGGNANVYADVGYSADGLASVRNLSVIAPAFRLAGGAGSYRADGRIAFRATGTSTQYGPLAVTASGTLARPLITLRAAHPNVGVQLTDVAANVVGTAAGYRMTATGGSPYGPFAADLLVRTGPGPLAIDIRRGLFAGVGLAGTIVQTRAGPYAGTLTLAGAGLNGTARLGAAGAYQRADLDLRAAAARVPGETPITIGAGLIRATAILGAQGPQLTGSADLRDVRYGTTLLASARARLAYDRGRGRVALIADGTSGVPFAISAQAAIDPTRILANARGQANGLAFHLAAPAVVTHGGGGWQLGEATIVLPQGQVRLGGSYRAGAIRGRALLDGLDLGLAQAALPGLNLGGKASGAIDLAWPANGAVPDVAAHLTIAGFTRTGALTVSDPVDVALLATLSQAGGADVRALVRRGGATVGRMQVRLAPIPAGGTFWTQRLLAAPLAGGIRYAGPAEVLWTLTGIAGQQVTGPIAIGADFGGRLAQPTVTGLIRANTLRYENETYGTTISRIALEGRFTQSQLRLVSLTGHAGSGTLSASGSVGLDAASGFPIDLSATLAKAQLARSDALGATVSGTIRVTNSRADGALVKGDLTIPQARYAIIRQGAAEVAELDGVRRRNAPAVKPAPSAVPSNWKLAIRVRAPNQIFVSGMGLEAEWATDLTVGGTATQPTVIGKLTIVRGTYSFAGRRFTLAQSGAVTFDGGPVTNPELDLAADTTVEGVTATINITGRAYQPQIAFTSTPTLPQDEVLSRLLFGSSVTSLSPTQALQLAAALNSLRGTGGGGLNPLGKLRSATGIDRLRVLGADKTTGQGTALAAGKYISNNIYVEVITDARGFTATQLDIALSKTLSVLSNTSSFGGSSVNLRYSKDY